MSYKIKHANQIVLTFVSLPVLVLLVALVFIAIRQHVLEKKFIYHTTVSNATGLSPQTPILFKGFQIGRVKKFWLRTDGNIGLTFHILNSYKHMMMKGSVLLRTTNPITNKTTLEFVQDRSSRIPYPEESQVLSADFREGKRQLMLISPNQGDAISTIINNLAKLSTDLTGDHHADQGVVPRLLVNVADISEQVNAGMNDARMIMAEVAILSRNLNKDKNPDAGVAIRLLNNMADISEGLNAQMDEVDALMKGLNVAINNYGDPDSLLIRLIDPSMDLFIRPLSTTLYSLTGAMEELEGILDRINDPELNLLMTNLNENLARSKKTLEALNNNPILRKGISPSQQKQGPASERLHEVKP
ncbi:MAG: MCE family protein [Candidatus Cloacimonetes bacterium]|nr:MCE family protein [Candidatus Cloacimonadota bacterium]